MRRVIQWMILLLCAGSGYAADVSTVLSPGAAQVGDTLHLEIHVGGAGGRSVRFPALPEGAFELLSADSTQASRGTMRYTVALYDTGQHVLPELPVVVGTGAAAETLRTSAQSVTIRSVLPDTARSLRPLKPYREHPFQLREILSWPVTWVIGIGLLAAAAWWVWYRFLRKGAGAAAAAAEVLLPPHEEAVRYLIMLRDKKYPARGMLKEFFTEYSHIMRRYLERRYGFPALEMTTWDLGLELEEDRYPSDWSAHLVPTLREADLVKFAKHLPDPNQCGSALDLGFELVDRTRPVMEPEVAEAAA
jgi:hypothetical protein